MLLLIDNFDSFTHNLARYFIELGQDVCVKRNTLTCQDIEGLDPDYLVFSPGPCTPDEAGVTLSAIRHFAGKIPILGVCLGYQAIGQTFGADVIRAQRVLHGKTSEIRHNHSLLFKDIPDPFTATRYHSLVLNENSLPKEFAVTAWCEEDGVREIMAIEHQTLPVMGVQFHPESLLTSHGYEVLNNFLKVTR
ncbi:aminodeoxychorismate/anthranilate synthase component II [Aestuariibacter sp. AA17]|uniref:Aminodeoxychorismate/anthranilate synthase component II n=1 Tax=Fluctibacter corallii TaxID=2984329 RepID=A0ABT3A6Q1_9ALTE|nr:aminodeoxychorismate/anthranilate synthase component II [Aestuariibacter sp. AA17]MCV2884365.1 aminodeoxychorismate/anthranilate synthase component II [Aestuariibacter sp. AA17]